MDGKRVRFILCDIKADLCEEWASQTKARLTQEEQNRFTIFCGPIEQLKEQFDCIVSPGNSYV